MAFVSNIVKSQFENKRIGRGILFFALPFILILLIWLIFGFSIDFVGLVLGIVRDAVYWVLASVLMYIVMIAFKGGAVGKKFSSILASFSTIYLVTFIAGLLMFLLIFVAIPGFFQKVTSLQGVDITFDQLVSVISSLALPSQEIMLVMWFILGLIALGAVLMNFYVFYQIGNLVKKTTIFSNLVFVVVFIGLSFLLSELIGFVFNLL